MRIWHVLGTGLVFAFGIASGCSSEDDGSTLGTGRTGGSGGSLGLPDASSGGSVFATGGTMTAGGTSAGGASGAAGSGPLTTCGAFGATCILDSECCSNSCDSTSGSCDPSIAECAMTGASCASPTECCTLNCQNNQCQAEWCQADAGTCTADAQCCSGSCDSGRCTSLNTACKTSGNTCTLDSDCCSQLCVGDRCQLAVSFCIQQGDVCAEDTDCCTGVCTIAAGNTVGTCAEPPKASAGCTGVTGTVCGSCGDCCSRLCAPYGPTGVLICQPASGCRVNGELCRETSDCCGAPGTGLPGDSSVTCQKEAGADIGRCRNGSASGDAATACTPQGDICHYKDYACNVSSVSNNCCGDINKKQGVCELDGLGIPRCNGLSTCRMTGDTCASAADCCDPVPCVPDESGVLRCAPPTVTCVEAGGGCTYNGDCCPGFSCIIPVGSSQGVCGVPTTGTGGAGGAPPVCAEYGQMCTTDSDCCNGVPCVSNTCQYRPR